MNWVTWLAKWLPIVGLTATLLALIDPLEGFPIVLLGGVLLVMASLQERSAHTRLIVAGVVTAAVGCAALVLLSLAGGVGERTGRSLWWLAVIAPYPFGVITYLVGAVLLLRERRTGASAARR